MKVLIAYGTRFGSTEEISQEIKKTIEEQGLDCELLNLKEIKSKKWPSPSEFDGILVGSSIKIAKWMNEPKKFLRMNKELFNQKEKTLGLFISSALALTKKEESIRLYLKEFSENLGISPDIYEPFGPLIDFTDSSRMGWFDQKMFKMASDSMEKEYGVQFDVNGRNDFRDWDQIRDFARKFADLVKNKES